MVLTKQQRRALFLVYLRDVKRQVIPFTPYLQWRRAHKPEPLLGGGGCAMIQWRGMWLGIETDGYTHS